jgi:hypothetical protein
MEFLHSDCVPGELAEKVIAAHKLHQESEEAEGMSAWLRLRLGRCHASAKHSRALARDGGRRSPVLIGER